MPTTTKSKTNPTTAERAQQTREHLAAAQAALASALATQQQAEALPDALLARRRSGDLTVTTPDLMTARAGVDLAVADVDYARAQVTKAERVLVNDETHLADAVAAALSKMLAGFSLTTTTEAHTIPKTVTAPEVYLEQVKASTLDLISGRISGMVDLYLARPAWARPIDADDVIDALHAGHVHADVTSLGSHTSGDVVEDHLRITVRAAWASSVLPTIRKINGENRFPQFLAGGFAQAMQQGTLYRSPSGGIGDLVSMGSTKPQGLAVDAAAECKSKTETITTQGVRRTTVTATVIAGSRDPGMDPNRMAGGMRAHVESQETGYAEGLGKIESIRLSPADAGTATVWGRHASGRVKQAWKVEAVFLSLPTA